MAMFGSVLALLRHLRAERGMALLLVIVVAFTAFVAAAIPRLYNKTLDEELQHRVTEAPADWRNISITMLRRSSVDDDETIIDRLSTGSLAYFVELPPTLQEIIAGFGYFTESQKSPVLQTRLQPRLDIRRNLQFRFQGDVDQHITLIDGRWAEPRQPVLFSELTATPGARGETPIPLYEVAISETSLTDLIYERGQLLTVRLNGAGQRSLIRITGIFTVNNPDEEFWNADTRLDEPVIAGFGTDFGEIFEAVALPHVDVYEDMRNRGGGANPWLNEWIFYVDPEQLTLENYPLVAGEIRQLKVTLGPIDQLRRPEEHYLASTSTRLQLGQQAGPAGAEVHNELPLIVDRFAGQARLTSSVIALATIGILGVGLAALGLLAALIADRRRGMVTVLRSRGAGKAQLTLARFVEGLLLCLPATLAGLLTATLIVDARSSPWSFRAAIVTGLFTVGLLVASAGGNIFPHLGSLLGSRTIRPGGVSFRRLMIEGLVIILAAAGIFILRQRGLEPDADTEGLGGFDPFLTAVPVLLALAAGIALLRLYPYPVRVLAWFARWMRGTVIFMGLRRLAYQSTAANLPLLVLLLAVGVSVFTSVVAHSVDRARIDATWTEVRADYRLDILSGFGAALPNLDLSNAPGAEGQAREFRSRDAMLSIEGLENPFTTFQSAAGNVPPFSLIATETNAYQEIIAGTAIEYQFPGELLTPGISPGIGTVDNPAPALITSSWPSEAGDRPPTGTLLHFRVLSDQISGPVSVFVEVIGIGPDYPGVNPNTPLVLMRWDTFVAAMEPQHPRPIRPTTIYLGGSDLDQADLEAEIVAESAKLPSAAAGRDVPLGIGITSRSSLLDDLRDSPIARGLTNSFRLSVALAAIYGGLVVVVALVLTARERSRDLAYLRTLGLDSRQSLGMTLTETVPGVLLACGLGVPLGIAIARLIEPGLDLRAFVGPEAPIAVLVDRPTAIAIAVGLALVSLISVVIFSLLARRIQLGEVLRVGE